SENFADRWNGKPQRAQAFFDWIEQAYADFSGLGRDLGLDDVIAKMAESLGEAPATRAGERFGAERARRRNTGVLGVSATGALGVTQSRPVPRHTFHGDASRSSGS